MFLEKIIRMWRGGCALDEDPTDEERYAALIFEASGAGVSTKIYDVEPGTPDAIALNVRLDYEFISDKVMGRAFQGGESLWAHQFYGQQIKSTTKRYAFLEKHGNLKSVKLRFIGVDYVVCSGEKFRTIDDESFPFHAGSVVAEKTFAHMDSDVNIEFIRDGGRVTAKGYPGVSTLLIPYGGLYIDSRSIDEIKPVYAIFKASQKQQIAFVTADDVLQQTGGKVDLLENLVADKHVMAFYGEIQLDTRLPLTEFINRGHAKFNYNGASYASESFSVSEAGSVTINIVFKKV